MKHSHLVAVALVLTASLGLSIAFRADSVSAVGNAINGGGTSGRIPKFTGANCIGNSVVREDGSGNVGIGATNPAARFLVNGGRVAVNGNQGGSFGILIANQNGAGPIATFSTNTGMNEQVVIKNDGTVGIRGGNPEPGRVLTSINSQGDAEWQIQGSAGRTPISSLPFTIDTCGSYFLTACLTVNDGDGITITASDVTLDLNGFTLSGAGGTLNGICVPGAARNISIFNGTVANWGGNGVYAENASNSKVTNVRVSSNAGSGIVGGFNFVIEGCTALDNGGDRGILARSGSTVSNCTANDNADVGITATGGSLVTDCSAWNNDRGFVVSSGVTMSNCSAIGNTFAGITASGGCSVLGNTCTDNDPGILVPTTGSRIEGNTLTGNTDGIEVTGTSNIIVKNTGSGNTAMNFNIGANNSCGQILSVSSMCPFTTDQPWANLEY